MAVEHAELAPAARSAGRTGIWIGSALGGVAFGEEQHAAYVTRGVRGVSPTLATAVFGGAAASNVAIDLEIRGPAIGNANSCASGATAIGQALAAIRAGTVDVALAGGAEAPLAPLTFGAFAMIKVLSQRNDDPSSASRPFDRDRDGFVMGEAAAILVLEERDAADAPWSADHRRARSGWGLDRRLPPHRAAPDGRGRGGGHHRRTGRRRARGRGDRLRQRARLEHAAQRAGRGARAPPALGPARARRAGLRDEGAVRPRPRCERRDRGGDHRYWRCGTASSREPATSPILDPEIDLAVLTGPMERRVDVALSTSFGFGGLNAALVLGAARD